MNMINDAKSAYYSDKLSNCQNQKKVFKIVESLVHNKGKSKLPTHDNPLDLSTKFSEYFVTKISNIRDHLDSTQSVPENEDETEDEDADAQFSGLILEVFSPRGFLLPLRKKSQLLLNLRRLNPVTSLILYQHGS